MSEAHNGGMRKYADSVALLPFGEMLKSIRATDKKAVHVGYISHNKYDDKACRDHHWIAHLPNYREGDEEFLSVRRSTSIGGVSYVTLEEACQHLQHQQHYEWEEATREVVDIEKTPIPYEMESSVSVVCPECDRFGATHPWKLENYVPDECGCGFSGEWNVR